MPKERKSKRNLSQVWGVSGTQKYFPDSLLASPEKQNPEKFKLNTFLITLSPKGDVTDETVQQFVAYIEKKTECAYAVTEVGEGGQKHIHAACLWKVPVEKRNIQDYWSKILVQDYPGSIGRYASKVTIMYNHGWYDEYLKKGGTVIYNNYVRERVESMFPSEELQQQLVEARGCPEARVHIADKLCDEWSVKDPDDASYESAVSFIKYRMHVLKKTPYFLDRRKLKEMCWFMYEHRNAIHSVNVDEKSYGNLMTGNTI